MRRLLIQWWIGMATVFILLLGHLRMYCSEGTRYYTFWDRSDALANALLMVLLGGGLAAAHAGARRTRIDILRRFADAVFVVVLGSGVVVLLRTGRLSGAPEWWMTLTGILAGLVGVLGLLCLHPRIRVVPRAARALCLVVSPAMPPLILQMAAYPEFSVRREILGGPRPAAAQPAALTGATGEVSRPSGVYLFIFDEWSYARTFGPQMDQEMPNLAEFVGHATVYHDAYAPFNATRLSLPGILFQTDDVYAWAGGIPAFSNATGNIIPVTARLNLFSRMKTRGYWTALAGFSHPYRRMFGAELDYCFAAPDGRGDDDDSFAVDDVWRHLRLAGALAALAMPKPAALEWRVRGWCAEQDLAPQLQRVADVHARALDIVREPGPVFAVLHYPLPHDPFLFDREGERRELADALPLDFGPYGPGGFMRPHPRNHVARYAANLRYLDTVLGELLEAMRSAGTLDEATIILTSDHTWRFDPELDHLYVQRGLPFRSLEFDPIPEELTHVPLIVRQAGQATRRNVHDRVELTRLFELPELADLAGQTALR